MCLDQIAFEDATVFVLLTPVARKPLPATKQSSLRWFGSDLCAVTYKRRSNGGGRKERKPAKRQLFLL